ncbi:hypothetical protein WJX81_007446 [Elliptochloris bilobata]|uniref:Prolyl 4-hydroxylase alpha subunit domain-containing protein n=1 Tax=Elliptochloris bilobata TaxID=381761 RepID=A0AAW1SKJ0_9CHLO
MEAGGSAHGEADVDYDKNSLSSLATTASLSSRIASLAIFGEDKATRNYDINIETLGEGDEEEELVEVAEGDLMRELDQIEPALQVCARLFRAPGRSPPALKRLSWEQVDAFRQCGYVVVDNFVPRDLATRIRAETHVLQRQGRFTEASRFGLGSGAEEKRTVHYTDRSARGDHILWLHPGCPPAIGPGLAAAVQALQELQEDLTEAMTLRQRAAEYQLALYPGGGAQYVRHRDAFPDDGSEEQQRRVTAILYANPSWAPAHGGKLRLWPPRTSGGSGAAAAASAAGSASVRFSSGADANGDAGSHCGEPAEHVSDAWSHAMKLGSSDGGGSFADPASDTCSTHSEPHLPVGLGPSLLGAGSIASSMIAQASGGGSAAEGSSVDGDGSMDGHARHAREAAPEPAAGMERLEVGAEAVVDVAPLAGRLVLFLAGAVEHAVLPCQAERIALTAWCQ